MLQSKDSIIVEQYKKKIQEITRVRRMIVFGSRARGDAVTESDLDVFVEIPKLTPHLRQRILTIAWELSLEYEVVISTFLASSHSLIDSPLAGNPIIHAIETEGISV